VSAEVPVGPDGQPLWDVLEWGTRGPPWRASLLGQVEERSALSGPFESLELSLGMASQDRASQLRRSKDSMGQQLRESGYSAERADRIVNQCAQRYDRQQE
jgi:hypothetical protein